MDSKDIYMMNKNLEDLSVKLKKIKPIGSVGFFMSEKNPYIFFENGSIFNLLKNEWVFKGNQNIKILKTGCFYSEKVPYFKMLENDFDLLVVDKMGNTKMKINLEKLFNHERLSNLYHNSFELFFLLVNSIFFWNENQIMVPEIENITEDHDHHYYMYDIKTGIFDIGLYEIKGTDLPFAMEFMVRNPNNLFTLRWDIH